MVIGMDRIVKLHLDSCGYLPGEIAVYFGLHAIQASAFWKITFQHQVSEDLSTLKKKVRKSASLVPCTVLLEF